MILEVLNDDDENDNEDLISPRLKFVDDTMEELKIGDYGNTQNDLGGISISSSEITPLTKGRYAKRKEHWNYMYKSA